MIKTGIYGGSFNPIHNGHIALARTLLTTKQVDEVWFLVSPQNPLKRNSFLLDDNKRLEMVRMALKDEPGMTASNYEFNLPLPSYMFNTLSHLSADYPQRSFSLIIGADNWLCFDRWAHAREIMDNYNILVYPRPGAPIEKGTLPPHVTLLNTPLYNISSTQIRQRIAKGESIEGLVPPSIMSMALKYYKLHQQV